MSAVIEDGAFLFGDALNVTAENSVLGVAVGASGGQAKDFGFTGLGSSTASTTTPPRRRRARDGRLAGDATIKATDTTHLIIVAGSLTRGQKVGIGASIGWNQVSRTTQAYVGVAPGDSTLASGGSFEVDGALTVEAVNGGFIGAITVAGASASNDKTSHNETAFALAFALARSTLADTTKAYIHHATITAGGNISLKATNETIVEAFSIGGSLARGNVNSVALAGAASTNTVDLDTQAFVRNSNNTSQNQAEHRGVTSTAGKVTLAATDSTQTYAQAGAVSIAWSQDGQLPEAFADALDRRLRRDQRHRDEHLRHGRPNCVSGRRARLRRELVHLGGRQLEVTATAGGSRHALAVGGSVSSATGGSVSDNVARRRSGGRVRLERHDDDGEGVRLRGEQRALATRSDPPGRHRPSRHAPVRRVRRCGRVRGDTAAGSVGRRARDRRRSRPQQGEEHGRVLDRRVDGGCARKRRLTSSAGGNVSALGIGVAVSVARGTGTTGAIAGAGSAAVNEVDGTIESSITASGGTKHVASTTGSVSLSATDSVDVTGIAGTVAFALGLKNASSGSTVAVAAGVSVVINKIGQNGGRSTKARIDGSIVTGHTDVTLTALSDSTILAVAVGGAGAVAGSTGGGGGVTGAFAGAGVGTENVITQTITASVIGDSVVTATTGKATLHATDSSEIHADAGGVAVAIAVSANNGTAASGSVGLAIALNTIKSDVLAYVDDSTLTGKSVELAARSERAPSSSSDYRIDALALSVAGAGSASTRGSGLAGAFAGAGSGARNRLDGTIHAYVKDSLGTQGITATGGEVTIVASDDSSIRADTGGFAIAIAASLGSGTSAAASIGISVSLNEIGLNSGRSVIAEIDNSRVTAAGAVSVAALSTATIDALAIAGSASGSGSSSGLGGALAGAGVGSANTIESSIRASVRRGSTVTANGRAGTQATPEAPATPATPGDVTVSATDNSVINAKAIGIAIAVGASAGGNAGAIAIGISVGINKIENDVLAQIDASTVAANAIGSVTVAAVGDADIHALSVAATLAIAAASDKTLAISGGGAASINSILSRTNAAVTASTITAAKTLTLDAHSNSTIEAIVAAVSLGIGAGGSSGAAAAIGIAVAQNYIGYDEHGDVPNDDTGNPKKSQIRASVDTSTISTGGALSAKATAHQTISATVVSVSVAVAGTGSNAFGFAGSGVWTQNQIKSEIRASVTGAGSGGVKPASILVEASDTSSITAIAGAAAVAVAVAASNAASVSIGVALAHNRIENSVEASLTNVPVDISGDVGLKATTKAAIDAVSAAASIAVGAGFGGVGVAVSGAGAESTNVILTTTNAFVTGGSVKTAGNLSLSAKMTGEITATVVAASLAVGGGSSTGVGVAVGIAVARNFIGWDPQGTDVPTYRTDQNVAALKTNDTVRVVSGSLAGNVYKYIGSDDLTNVDLSVQTFGDASLWLQVSVYGTDEKVAELKTDDIVRVESGPLAGDVYEYIGPKVTDGDPLASGNQLIDLSVQNFGDTSLWSHVSARTTAAEVQAYVRNAGIDVTQNLIIDVDSDARIEAIVVAVAAAVSGGGTTGVSVSGAGVYTENKIATLVKAFVESATHQSLTAGAVTITADDASRIRAVAGAAALAAAFGGSVAGVSIAVGLSIAFNEVDNDVAAYVKGVVVTTKTGALVIEATTKGATLFDLDGDPDELGGQLDDASATDDDDADDVSEDADVLQAVEESFKAKGHPLTTGKYSTSQVLPAVFTTLHGVRDLKRGDTVLVRPGHTHGGVAGTIYVFDGADEDDDVDLGLENYASPRWKVGLWVPLAKDDVVRVTSTGLSYRYIGPDPTGLVNLGAQAYATSADWKYEPPMLTKIEAGQVWQLTSGTATFLITKVVDEDDTTRFVVSRPTIDSVSVAASFAASWGSTAGVAVAGAGAFARNTVLGTTNAYVLDSSVSSAGNVDLHATSTSSISATIVAASLAIGAGGGAGVGVSIGVSISENSIGKRNDDDEREPLEVRARVESSAVSATGAGSRLELKATADQTISALVLAISAAVGGGGAAGVAASGAGSSATNTIIADVQATIDGDGRSTFAIQGIKAPSVTLEATDRSKIKALALGASLAAGFGGAGGGALSIGVSLARNEIDNDIEASISGVGLGVSAPVGSGVTATVGDVTLVAKSTASIESLAIAVSVAASGGGVAAASVSGAGADATNVILTRTNAFVLDSKVTTTGASADKGNVSLTATNSSQIRAVVAAASAAVSGGFGAAGLSIGVSLSRNLIGWKGDLTESPAQVQAYIRGSTVDASGNLNSPLSR